MFKDDRFISILSGVVLMIAIGTVVQRGGPLLEFFTGESGALALAPDEVATESGTSIKIDVLGNDTGLTARDRANLEIVSAPGCGTAFVRDGLVTYTPEARCAGAQDFSYGIGLRAQDATAEVTVFVRPEALDADGPAVAAAPRPTPRPAPSAAAAPDPVRPGAAPDPVRRAAPLAPAAPSLTGFDTAALGLDGPEAPAAPAAGRLAAPSGFAPDAGGSQTIAPAGRAEPVARPAAQAPQAPAQLTARLDDSQNDDFAAAASRGGLLSRATRARSQAAPAPGALALAEPAPARTQPAEAWRPDPIADLPPTPGAGAIAEDAPRRGADPAGPDAPLAIARAPEPAAPVPAPGEARAEAQEPQVRRPAIGGLRPGGFGGDRISQLSAPPEAADGQPVRRLSGDMRPRATFGIARFDRRPEMFEKPSLPQIGAGPEELDAKVPRAPMPKISSEESGRIALVAPESGLGDVLAIGRMPLTIVPVETDDAPAELAAPAPIDQGFDLPGRTVRRFDPDQPAFDPDRPAIDPDQPAFDPDRPAIDPDQPAFDPDRPAIDPDRPAVEPGSEDIELAARSPAEARCVVLPQVNIAPQAHAITRVIVDAPCFVGQPILLRYEGIELGAIVDADGGAAFSVPGFQRSSQIELAYPDGTSLTAEIPFSGTDRIVRVALVWNAPVTLELHAKSAFDDFWSPGHIRPENLGDPRTARRRGSGYLLRHDAPRGVGDSLRVYTHYVRRSVDAEVVDLLIDFASRRRVGARETCGNGPFAAPAYRVVRATFGQMERERRAIIGAIGCNEVADYGNRLDDAAVRDIVISRR